MRLEQLSFLVEVSRCNSVSLAASRLFMTQQNVSASLRKLEEELGFELMERTHHGVSLTPKGEEVLALAEDILHRVENLKHIGQRECSNLAGDLFVDMVPYIALPEMIVEFYRHNPEANIKTSEKSPQEIIRDLQEGTTDIGFVYLRAGECLETLGLTQENLSDDQLYICAGKKMNLPKRTYTTSALFEKKLPFVVFNGLYDWTMETLDQMGGQKPLVYRADIQLYKKMILEGLAVGFATETGVEHEAVFKKGEVDMFKVAGVHLVICMVYKKEPTSLLKEVFLETARERFR